MADRRSFLGAVSGVAVSVVLAKTAEAQTAPDKPSPGPSSPAAPAASGPASSGPSASPKPPSAGARAQAEAMRAFDPKLSEAEIETIARGIDGSYAAGQKLNKHGRVLRNGDEPITRFNVDAAARR
jgi:hypothetical protein